MEQQGTVHRKIGCFKWDNRGLQIGKYLNGLQMGKQGAADGKIFKWVVDGKIGGCRWENI